MLQMLDSEDLSDVTFRIGEDQTEFNLHRIFLAMISPVFKAMLYGQMQEAQPNSDVIIEDITSDAFQCIVHFAYCNDPKITSQNVLSVLAACDKYQITKLQETCYDFLKSNLNSSNFLSYYYTAKLVGFFDWVVIEALKSHISMHYNQCLPNDEFCAFFEDVMQSDLYGFVSVCESFLGQLTSEQTTGILESEGFLQMSLKSMLSFLKHVIGCKEEDIWESLVEWVVHQTQNAEEDDDTKEVITEEVDDDDAKTEEEEYLNLNSAAMELLKSVKDSIRFGLMDGRYFTEHVIPLGLLTDTEIVTIFKYLHYPEGGCSPFSTTTRNPIEEIMYSTHYSGWFGNNLDNTYQSLTVRNLARGCGVGQVQDPFIEAVFERSTIRKMEIAPLSNGWGCKFLNGAQVVTAEGHIVAVLSGLKTGEIKTISLDCSVITTKLRIMKKDQTYLGIGFWKLYGIKSS